MNLWEHDTPVAEYGLDVPAWISEDITCYTVAAIKQGGCASGAYMPAVTYHKAAETMAEHGDDVLQYIEDTYDEIPAPRPGESWSGLAVFYLSLAVETWALDAYSELDEMEEPEAD